MKLRHHTFFTVDEINEHIGVLLDTYNDKVIKRLGKSRRELFDTLDKPMLHPLRANNYIFREFKRATVGIDYHIELEDSGYSVPYKYLGCKVDVSYNHNSVLISLDAEVIAHHTRLHERYHDSTLLEHMPTKATSTSMRSGTLQGILTWAKRIGTHTTALMESVMQKRSHPTRGYKSCMAILSFSKTYGNEALEKTAKVALEIQSTKVSSVESMLKTKSYLQHEEKEYANNTYLNKHENLRGSEYYTD